MKTPKRPIFAVTDEKLYIKSKYAGIPTICQMVDGITWTFFGKEKTAYLNIDVAIQWHEKEIKETNGKWKRDFLDHLMTAKGMFLSGKVTQL